MKKPLLSLVTVAAIALTSFGQAPEGFKYQAIVRDASSNPMTNQAVEMQITIQQGSIGGTAVYQETFASTTNGYGLVNLEIGTGTSTDDFSTIDWSNGPYFIETAVDITGGSNYAVMGSSQLMSVPYTLYAKQALNAINDEFVDSDADPTNEIDTWQTLSGIPADFSDNIDNIEDTDSDPTNEIDTWQTLSGIPSDFSDNIDNTEDDDSDPTNEIDTWQTLTGIPTDFSDNIDNIGDSDSDQINEIQTISKSGTTITLSNNGGSIEDSIGTYYAGSGIEIINNVISSTSCNLSIGDTHLGGIIFYLEPSGCHGLICKATELSGLWPWHNTGSSSYINIETFGNCIGCGLRNTKNIVNNYGVQNTYYAAYYCDNYYAPPPGNYLNWYLPSLYELELMYDNIGPGNLLGLGNLGGFVTSGNYTGYWSSTENSFGAAWYWDFQLGQKGGDLKMFNYRVRPVARF